MKFDSIREYFYKLNNYCLLLVLLPPSIFIVLYFLWPGQASYSLFENESLTFIILIFLFVLIVVELTIVHLYVRNQLRKLSSEPSLGDKMDRYAPLLLARQMNTSFSAGLVAVSFYLTVNNWAVIFFGLLLFWMWLQWPSPEKFCNDLVVRKDERELILSRKESL